MKVGIIGAGYWGKKHVDEYSKLGVETFVSDLDESNLQFCKNNFKSETTTNYKKILENDEIRIISICTPNNTHYSLAMEALNANKNIILEKPLAVNSKEGEEIISLADKKKLHLLVGHIFRFNNAIAKIKEIIEKKELGKIYAVNLIWTNLEPVFPGRDILFDLGVHPLDIIENIFDSKPKNISCNGTGFRQKNLEFAVINFQIDNKFHEGNIFISIDLSWLNPIRRRRMVIVGSEKTAIIDCVKQKIELIYNPSEIPEQIQILPNNTLRDELEFFVQHVVENKKILDDAPNGKTALKTIKIIEMIKDSIKKDS